ncbi:MAG: alpha/beta hydrolase [Pseudomonadota bacterium]
MLRRTRMDTPQGAMAALEFGDPARDLSCLFLHATGFNAMTYQSILAPLGLRARVAALDQRGHGRSELAYKTSFVSWNGFRDDVIRWIEHHAPNGLVLGGHSMGGTVSLLVAGKRPDLVKGLVLADPVILPPAVYRANHLNPLAPLLMKNHSMARTARKRRSRFPSAGDVKSSYAGRGAFATWREPFLDDYLLDGVLEMEPTTGNTEEETWILSCAPAMESAVFAAQRNRPWRALAKVRKAKIPLSILRAEKGSVMTDATAQRILRTYSDATVKTIRGTSHFLPMEAPYAVREELSAYLSRIIEGFGAADEGPVQRSLERTQGTRMS